MQNRARAFTLVEVVIVSVIIAILAGLGVVSYQTLTIDANDKQARSMMGIVETALGRYYAKNNEYPSAAALASNSNGRNLSAAQYRTISTMLGIPTSALQQSKYKFVPCWVTTAACVPSDTTDTFYILYFTRSASDIAGNTNRVYTAPTSGCTYTINASTGNSDSGYSSYMLMYKDPKETNWFYMWNVHTSGLPTTVQGAYCPITKV